MQNKLTDRGKNVRHNMQGHFCAVKIEIKNILRTYCSLKTPQTFWNSMQDSICFYYNSIIVDNSFKCARYFCDTHYKIETKRRKCFFSKKQDNYDKLWLLRLPLEYGFIYWVMYACNTFTAFKAPVALAVGWRFFRGGLKRKGD